MEILEQLPLTLKHFLILGIIVSIITSAIKAFYSTDNKKIDARKILIPVALVCAVLVVPIESFSGIVGLLKYLQKVFLSLLATISFSILFYVLVGEFFVDSLFKAIKGKIDNFLKNWKGNESNEGNEK